MSELKHEQLIVDGPWASLPTSFFRAVFEHTHDAILIIDPVTDQMIEVNPRASSLLGYSREELLDLPVSSIYPNDMADLLEFAHSVFEKGHGLTSRLRCRQKNGKHLAVEVSACSAEYAGRRCLVALLSDVTARNEAEAELARSERRFQMIIERSFDGILLVNRPGTILYASPANASLLGYPDDELMGMAVLDLIHPDERESAEKSFSDVVEEPETVRTTRCHFRHGDGSWRWIEATLSNLLGELSVGAVMANLRDISALEREEEAKQSTGGSEEHSRSRAAVAEERYKFLLQASTMLSSALDAASALEVLTDVTVPALADLCLIDMTDEEAGTIKRIAVHADESALALGERLKDSPPSPKSDHPAIKVMQTGEPQLVPDVGDDLLSVIAKDAETFRMMSDLGLRSCLCVPIVARWSLGTLTLLVRPGDGRRYGESDLALAQDLARRAALALDNASLFESSKQLALTLQKSLLPSEIPKVPGAEIAARYHAAGEANQVGGDFYDLFATGEDGWAAVIGDVCGKGADAAALTALARHTIRAAKMQLRKPRRILSFLNQVVLQSGHHERFMTVAYCRLRPRDRGIHVTLARAGHPAPLVLRRDGTVKAEGRPGSLIGVLTEPDLSDRAITLDPGDALVLYTDGVTEARGSEERFGQKRLISVLEHCVGMDAEGIANRIEDEVFAFQVGKPRDDMALMIVRVPDGRASEEG